MKIQPWNKKRKPKYTLKRDAGNVEQNVATFNKNMTFNTGAGLGGNPNGGQGMAEGVMKDFYMDIQDSGKGIKDYKKGLERRNAYVKDEMGRPSRSKPQRDKLKNEYTTNKAKIDFLDNQPSPSQERKDWLINQIRKGEKELRIDKDTNYNWRKYLIRHIEEWKQELKNSYDINYDIDVIKLESIKMEKINIREELNKIDMETCSTDFLNMYEAVSLSDDEKKELVTMLHNKESNEKLNSYLQEKLDKAEMYAKHPLRKGWMK